jgi:uncharacterized damage-inducible protein DinB
MSASRTTLLLHLLDTAYQKQAWHGPNLRGSVRGLTPAEAEWRPAPGRRSIADIVVHAAYWKYAVRRRLTGLKRGSFALPGSNWFALPAPLTAEEWRNYVALLAEEHQALRATVAEFSDRDLDRSAGGRFTRAALIAGIAAHDLYHTGQIQLLKRLGRQAP